MNYMGIFIFMLNFILNFFLFDNLMSWNPIPLKSLVKTFPSSDICDVENIYEPINLTSLLSDSISISGYALGVLLFLLIFSENHTLLNDSFQNDCIFSTSNSGYALGALSFLLIF